ncbi:MAG: FabA/FabZ family ACP-dehydratase [Blastochloris sp.]|nr:FabA/FabZ family ACP-dehydratase [Blastochloris sp.]
MISAHTPHGSGFSFIDSFQLSDDIQSIIARKRLDPSMPFFADHFPEQPLMPGVLLIESAAQACGILWGALAAEEKNQLTMLAQVQQFKIKKTVFPNEHLDIQATLQRDFGSLAQFEVSLSVQSVEVATGILVLGRKTS